MRELEKRASRSEKCSATRRPAQRDVRRGFEVWENERTSAPVRVFGVRLHSMGVSLWEIVAVFDWLGVD